MTCVPVRDRKTEKDFYKLPFLIYRDDPNWIPPLNKDIEAVFDPRRNNFFAQGSCARWIVRDASGKTTGRVAAFVNEAKAFKYELPTGGLGFFESIDDKETAFLLFDTAIEWLRAKGMKVVEGPINFGENDKFWGLLIKGFIDPSYGMNYNPPYYSRFFEEYGFTKEYDQLTNYIDATRDMPERFTTISDWVMNKPGYSFRHFSTKEFDRYASDFREIYNDAWQDFENFTPIDPATIRESFRQMKPVMDERIIWFAYFHDEPIAFVLCLPDVNQVLKNVKGKLNLVGKLRFVWNKTFKPINRLRIIVMGCKKKFQNKGIESALIRCLQKEVLPRKTILGVELAWVADWNKKMMALHEAAGAMPYKVHRTYSYEFPSG